MYIQNKYNVDRNRSTYSFLNCIGIHHLYNIRKLFSLQIFSNGFSGGTTSETPPPTFYSANTMEYSINNYTLDRQIETLIYDIFECGTLEWDITACLRKEALAAGGTRTHTRKEMNVCWTFNIIILRWIEYFLKTCFPNTQLRVLRVALCIGKKSVWISCAGYGWKQTIWNRGV